MIALSLLMLWAVFLIAWFSDRRKSEALRKEVEKLTDEVDELRNQFRPQKTAPS